MPHPAFPKFTRQSLSVERSKCCVCGGLAAYRIQCEPAAHDSDPFDICHSDARQCGYVDEIPGRLVTSFDGLPMSTAQHDAHVFALGDAAHAARLRDPAVQARITELDRGLQRRHMRLASVVPPQGSVAAVLKSMADEISRLDFAASSFPAQHRSAP